MSAVHRQWLAEQAIHHSPRLVLEDPHLRATGEAARPAVRTASGIVIGAAWQPAHGAHYAQAASGPHRRAGLWRRLWAALTGRGVQP